MKTVRIFVSSPGDVAAERAKADEIFRRLQAEFSGVLHVDPYFWEHEPMLAHRDFQSQIEPPSRFDLCVCLLWARLGSRLDPARYRKPDGGPYSSGTEFEVLDALESFRKSGAPEVLIYRRRIDPFIPLTPKEERERVCRQYDELQAFVAELTKRDGHFVVATNSYRGLDEFEEQFERAMRKVLLRHVPPGVAGARVVKTWTQGSPFRGLRHFEFEHAPIFFGRTRDISEVLAALRQQAMQNRAFVLIFGGSGVGKSSLVRAGVLPWLVKPGVIDGVGLWRRAIIRPGESRDGDLFNALAHALIHPDALPELVSDGTTLEQISVCLRETPQGIGMLIKGALSQAARETQLRQGLEKQPRALCALVVDQLEELFTLERLAEKRDGFLLAIDALARSGHVWVLATLRSDFYERCEKYAVLMDLKNGPGQYHLRVADKVQLGQMIRLPAAAAGLLFEEDRETGRRLDDVLRDSALASPCALPLLEFALEELYRKRDSDRGLLLLDVCREMGGVEGALGKQADESFRKTSARAQESFGKVFRKLVTINIDKNEPAVRQRPRKDELDADPGSRELVDQLIADRLLVVDRTEENVNIVSVAHEAMLKSWPRLDEWIGHHRESLKSHAEITADTRRWIENGRNSDYLYPRGLPLERAEQALDAGFLAGDESEFVRTALRRATEHEFNECLSSGHQLFEYSQALRSENPALWTKLLSRTLDEQPQLDSRGRPTPAAEAIAEARARATTLLGRAPVDELAARLVSLVVNDPAEVVRRAAAASLVQLDQPAFFDELVSAAAKGNGTDAMGGLARVRIAADAVQRATSFEPRFTALDFWLRGRIMANAWLLRLKRGLPTLLIVLVPVLFLSSLSAAIFKFFPGLLNYALCQATPSGLAASFHGVTASFLWGGMITLGIMLHRVVFGNERGKRSFFRPSGALAAAVIAGIVSSYLLLLVISAAFQASTIFNLGWTTAIQQKQSAEFWNDVLWQTRAFWPYVIMGGGLGLGLACTTNGLTASRRWAEFLEQQSAITGVADVIAIVRALVRLALRFAWPIPLFLIAADVAAFYVLRSAPAANLEVMSTCTEMFLGGLPDPSESRAWKMSAWGQGLGIAFDSATQAVGGFFCIVGMGLGIVAIRYGVKFEPRKN